FPTRQDLPERIWLGVPMVCRACSRPASAAVPASPRPYRDGYPPARRGRRWARGCSGAYRSCRPPQNTLIVQSLVSEVTEREIVELLLCPFDEFGDGPIRSGFRHPIKDKVAVSVTLDPYPY